MEEDVLRKLIERLEPEVYGKVLERLRTDEQTRRLQLIRARQDAQRELQGQEAQAAAYEKAKAPKAGGGPVPRGDDAIIGEIRMFAGNYAPEGWALCNGQWLPIAGFQALFSVISTTYGGDGKDFFALPDMRGRVPVHQGQGIGLGPRQPGQKSGAEAVQVCADAEVSARAPAELCVSFIIALNGMFPVRSDR